MRVLISPGHTPEKPGAVEWIYGQKIVEHHLNCVLSYIVKDLLLKFSTALEPINLTAEIIDPCTPLKKRPLWAKPDDLLISIHHNSYVSKRTFGFEVLYSSKNFESTESLNLAGSICKEFELSLEVFRNRGIKLRNDLYILKNAPCPAVLIEPGFMSCPSELKRLINPSVQLKIAHAICRGIVYWNAKR